MMGKWLFLAMLFIWARHSFGAGDAAKGASAFQQCAVCHSTQPGVQMTGPSLAHVWGRKAATEKEFDRYSEALKNSGVTWDAGTLDKWLTDPAQFIPGNAMPFPGIRQPQTRQDIIAYLQALSNGATPKISGGGGMAGMGRSAPANLKSAPPEGRVTALTHCRDTYTVTTADGKTNKVWEYNLRLKTDSSANGPERGKPIIVGGGMVGDRASVVFSAPAEISAYIRESCGK